jgi:phage-related protein
MEWEILYFSEQLQQVILNFPAGIQARYIHLTERMQTFGPDLGMPHTRAMGHGLFELRIKAKEGIGRVFFGILARRRIVMLHAFLKKTAKTPARELKFARNRLKEVKANEDTQGNGPDDAQESGRES